MGRVLRNRSVLVAQLGFVLFTLVLHGAWLALVVYAFERGGLGEAGVVSLAVLVPAAFSGPFVAVFFDRLPARFGLSAGLAGQALTLLVVAVAVSVEASSLIVYGAMTIFSIVQMSSRPTLSAILPRVVRDPAELTAANSLTGLIETIGLILGPATVGLVLLLFDDPSAPFFASFIALAFGAAVCLAITDSGLVSDLDEGTEVVSVVREVRDGIQILKEEGQPRRLVILMATQRLIAGALDIGVVVVAIDQLGRDDSTAGLLGSAIGMGAVLGAALTVLLIGRRRLTMPLSLSLLLSSLPVAVVAFAGTSLPLVLVLLAAAGLGRPILEVAGRTLLQGLASEEKLANLFGFLEGIALLVLAIGSLVFAQLTVLTGLKTTLIVFGLAPVAILMLLYRKVRLIDEDRPHIDPQLLTLVREIPLFAPLPAFGTEQMLTNMTISEFAPAAEVFSAGDPGDQFYVVDSGTAVIELEAGEKVEPRGAFFGEIALLTDQPRTAGVRAGDDGLRAYALSRDVFLSSLSASSKSRRRADVVAARRSEVR